MSRKRNIYHTLGGRNCFKFLHAFVLFSTLPLFKGDSGGSFVCKEDGRYVLRGAVSWGHSMCRTDHYTVFARVSNYIGWINEKIGKNLSVRRCLVGACNWLLGESYEIPF